MNLPTAIAIVVVSILVAAAILILVKNKKNGKSACGNCSDCPYGDKCQKKEKYKR